MIQFENEVCKLLGLPSIPLKEWDGKSSFKDGVAVTNLACDYKAYAVCTFDADTDKEPRVKKTFANEPFYGIDKVFVVPSYMDLDTKKADLDEESKEAAERLANEAAEIEQNAAEDSTMKEMEELSEWVFPEIHNAEEAQAYLRAYNIANKIKGKVPTNAETLKMRLMNIYYSQKKNK